ncbi:hypothetical protein GCM10009733_063450 [Nonomuraea maheshkhaliensis]|uniref:Uncharacterized protein n=1 Tax=Nonomuraea maheshkhaliensis TaxID=419590 RepID=A0ABN2FR65_9ACTN
MESRRECASTCETTYLMASPVNRRGLSEAIASLEAGGGIVRELADDREEQRPHQDVKRGLG